MSPSLWWPCQRATLLYPSGPETNRAQKHLQILLTDPSSPEASVLMVGISSYREGTFYDPTCFLYAGDHEFIRHTSFVHYRNMREVTASKLQNGVNQGLFDPKEALAPELFMRVAQGVHRSRYTPNKFKDLFSVLSPGYED